ncbi:sugar ABC transporter substrate-binding protein [Mycetocola reblochoni]|uniref:sugar ABC transporter substrate-binding protein n=1 Tax=Mycetocola reblochoni TaxID=331618 RepID=UPI003F991DF5
MRTRPLVITAVVAVGALALAGCSSPAPSSTQNPDGTTTVTVRLWDETVAASYEESFAAFEKANSDIDVEVSVVPWDEYWTQLRTDVAGSTAADVFWVNSSSYAGYADSNNLVNIDEALGSNARGAWESSVVDQFTRDDVLWGVPQVYDAGIATYYNADLLEEAGVDPESLGSLVWSPDEDDDTFLDVAKKLTVDESGTRGDEKGFSGDKLAQYGTNIGNDLQAILLPYIGSNGGSFEDGEQFSFAEPASAQAFQYLVDAVNDAHVAPPGAETNADGDFSRDAFIDGKLALFQSGVCNLKNVADGADFDWGVVPMASGPKGRVSVTNGIVAAGNAQSEKQDQIKRVLSWMGSEEGNAYLGTSGSAVPAVTAAEDAFTSYWSGEDVDVTPFFDSVNGATPIPAPSSSHYEDGAAVFEPIFDQMFEGDREVGEALTQAQDLANVAVTDG